MEKEARARARKQNLKKIILSSLYAAGILSMAVMAPNVAGSILKLTGKNKEYRARRTFNRLVHDGFIKTEELSGKNFARLTPLGEKKVEMLYAGEITIKKPSRWDGKWRMVIYDLKEGKKSLRDKLRTTLSSLGFLKLQDSVWVYPYDCEDLIALIKADFKIGKEILYMITDHLENDSWIKKSFGIPK